MAAAIRAALPEFEEWTFDAGEAAARFMALAGDDRDRLRMTLPPGFAEGRQGAFLRATRGLLRVREGVQSIYQLLQESPDERTFGTGMLDVRVSDVIDLIWMVAGPLELRAVHDLLERLAAAVLSALPVQCAPYDEPRYRSALQLHVAMTSRGSRAAAFWPNGPADRRESTRRTCGSS